MNNDKKIIIIGSGWGSTSFLKYINYDIYDITVISPNSMFLYTPLLVYSIFNNNLKLEYDIRNMNPNIKYIKNKVSYVDFENNKIIFDNKELEYVII